MSWSVNRMGRPAAVAAAIAADIARIKCSEPEEAIKNSVGAIVATALAAFPEDTAVRVEAHGSQSASGDKASNSLSFKIEPLYGFIA